MPPEVETLIRVHYEWDGWRSAEVRLDDLGEVHWFQPTRAPQPLVHAQVSCAQLVTGESFHECDRSTAPHQLLVCILKKHTIPTVYAELARRADQRRALPPNGRAVRAGTTAQGQRASGPGRSAPSAS